jgi:hypothetical protein
MGVHTTMSLKSIKNHIVFSYKNSKKYVFACFFGFNNQFIKIMRTRPIFQKYQKLFCFPLISGIMNLYVRHISDIK